MKNKFKKGDKVVVISGKCKNQTGVIKAMLPVKNRILIEGINMQACFSKQKKQNGKTKEMSIHYSNVSHIDPVSNEPTRVNIIVQDGMKNIVAKKSGKVIRTVIDLKKIGRYE
mgnify:CR=1 FL=1